MTEVTTEINCPDCHSRRPDGSTVCPTCGAPPLKAGEKRSTEEEVRSADLEPYITLVYIARLFKVLAVLMMVMLIFEIIATISTEGFILAELLGRVAQMLVLAGAFWGGGDLTLLLIDAGHDLRVVRILLGRINAELHRKGNEKP